MWSYAAYVVVKAVAMAIIWIGNKQYRFCGWLRDRLLGLCGHLGRCPECGKRLHGWQCPDPGCFYNLPF